MGSKGNLSVLKTIYQATMTSSPKLVGSNYFAIILTMHLFVKSSSSIQWLALSRVGSIATVGTSSNFCDDFADTLVNKQIQFCKKHPGFMQSVQSGATRAIDECKFQFRSRRWNCSTLDDVSMKPIFYPLPNIRSPAKRKRASCREISPIEINEELLCSYFKVTFAVSSSILPRFYQEFLALEIKVKKDISSNITLISDGQNLHKLLSRNPIVQQGTREAAFVHAISAAGVAHALTRACSAGELEDCGCDRTIRGSSTEGFQWAGCSDNVLFGTSFSRTFVDAREHKFTKRRERNDTRNHSIWRSLMNLHNNEAGRKVIEKSMRIDCKCHGVSGSCELKTCWKAMPSFREIGELLKEKFDSATEVEPRTSHSGTRRHLIPRSPTYKPHTDADLVYLERSPDYCEFDSNVGSLGTHDRFCNKTSKAIDGCDLLCCNRGYKSHRERRAERCMCKFHWCCSVQCKTCIRDLEVYTCN